MLDANLQLSGAQPVTTTAFSINTLDFSSPRDIGVGSFLGVLFTVDESAAAAGAATVKFEVVASASPSLSSPVVMASTDAISKSELVASRRPFNVSVPNNAVLALPAGYRYVGVRYTVTNGPLTAGKFSAWLQDGSYGAPIFGNGFTVA